MSSIALLASTLSCSESTGETEAAEVTTSASEDADAADEWDSELEQLFHTGCERSALCAPDAYVVAYADDQACSDDCHTTFSVTAACREAAGPYAACTAALECKQ